MGRSGFFKSEHEHGSELESWGKVVDADSAAEKSRAAAQQTSRELTAFELAYRGKVEDLAQASAHATQLEAQLEEMEATERAREQTARARAESAVALSDSKGMVDVAVQSTGRTTFEMTSFMEELRVAEAAQARAEEERTQAREEARKAREACAALREEMGRLLRSTGRDAPAVVETMPPDGEKGQVEAEREGKLLEVNGTEFQGDVNGKILPSSHWNFAQTRASELLSTEDGEILKVSVSDQGTETIEAAGRPVQATKYLMDSDIDVTLWYDESGRWVKLAFTARGQNIEYVLTNAY